MKEEVILTHTMEDADGLPQPVSRPMESFNHPMPSVVSTGMQERGYSAGTAYQFPNNYFGNPEEANRHLRVAGGPGEVLRHPVTTMASVDIQERGRPEEVPYRMPTPRVSYPGETLYSLRNCPEESRQRSDIPPDVQLPGAGLHLEARAGLPWNQMNTVQTPGYESMENGKGMVREEFPERVSIP